VDATYHRVVAGIDLAAGRGVTEVALLRMQDEDAAPIFVPEGHRQVVSDDDILAVLAEARPSVIAIDAPLSLPAPVAAAVRGESSRVVGCHRGTEAPAHGTASGLKSAHRLGDMGNPAYHEVASENEPSVAPQDIAHSVGASCGRPAFATPPSLLSSSPYTRAVERDPIWSELGLRPLPVSFLGGLTFRALALLPKLRAILPDAGIIEVFPTATLRLLGIRPAEARKMKREAKTSVPARAEVQAGLAWYIAGLRATSPEPLGADLLDALAAALTAVAFLRGTFTAIGDLEEGQLVLPNAEFARVALSCPAALAVQPDAE
jgi:predicted nuclease with RNAse H fold